MTMVYVPWGFFKMGSDIKFDEQPVHYIQLDAYWIDRTEVTNAMYASCVSSGTCTDIIITSTATNDPYYGNGMFDNYPVMYVSWNQANTYCQWVGGRLPTEAEWEKAARGTDGQIYPWGNGAPNPTMANYSHQIGSTTEVGSYSAGASPYGALDMAGNVWEWVMDFYDSEYYSMSPSINPPGASSGFSHVLRGGSWSSSSDMLRTSVVQPY